jgi:hypothetical protein
MSNETALTKIENAQKSGAVVYFDKSNAIPTVDLYKLDVTIMKIGTENCHKIGSGKKTAYMPKKEITDRIAEANGIVFVEGYTRRESLEDTVCGKRTIYIGCAKGKKRLPDGSWRTSNVANYDFDPTLRTMLDFDVTELTPETKQKRKFYEGKPYGSTLAKAIMECEKFATQRASTGSRLMVIRELAGIPISFTEEEINKDMAFGRIIQNTEYILQTPEGRAMATAQALGVDMSTLFGGRKILDNASGEPHGKTDNEPPDDIPPENDTANLAAEAAADGEPDFPEDSEGKNNQQEETEFDRLTATLAEYMTYKEYLDVTTKSGTNPYKLAQEEMSSLVATEESREKMIKRLRDYLIAKKVPGVA